MTRLLPEAVLFDLDGTLVDSLPDIAEALGQLMGEHGLPPHPPPAVARMIGHGVRSLVARAFDAHGRPQEDAALTAATARYLDLYEPRATRLTRLFPGAAHVVARLAAEGVKLGVCTNKPGAVSVEILEALGLGGRFGAVVGGDAGPARKPAPDLLWLALDRLGAGRGRAVMVGDSAADVASARAAGLAVVAVDWGYTALPPAELGADRVLTRFEDLPDVLADLAGALS